MRKIIFVFVLLFVVQSSWSQPAERRISRKEYVSQWADVAVQHMHIYGIPASVTLAQGILESADGNSALAKYANNHFGIKCHDWTGDGFYKDDDKKDECFRRYKNAAESYEDHALFLKSRSRYDFLFDLKVSDYKGWAKGLRKAGYATNPKYANLLIKIIEDHELYQYDKMQAVSTPPLASLDQQKQQEVIAYQWHHVLSHPNKIKCVKVKEGDTVYKIAKEFDMNMWQIHKYNDFKKQQDILEVGTYVYLQPKRNKSKKFKTYTVDENAKTLRAISQLMGIKLKKLTKKNPDIDPEAILLPGSEVALR